MTRINKLAVTLLAAIVVSAATPVHAQTYSVVSDFSAVTNGPSYSLNGLVAQGEDGSLYSTSFSGTAFKVTPDGNLKVLYRFCSQANCSDGSSPLGGLVLRPDGHFLGTTTLGGSANAGTVFDISPTGTLTTLYSFTGGSDGGSPYAAPIMGPDGEFYGVTKFGGSNPECGVIYRLSAVFTVLHNFDGPHGCEPTTPLVLGTDGNLYGMTFIGGTSGAGVIFQLQLPAGKAPVYTVLANLDRTNGLPSGTLIQGNDGNFYGTTLGDTRAQIGSIFKITPSGTLTLLFTLNNPTADGYEPEGLVLASDGNFYGVTSGDSFNCISTCSILFQFTPTGTYSVLHVFETATGYAPYVTPIQHTNGLLYGDTSAGGTPPYSGVFYSWNDNLPPFVSTVQLMGAVGSEVEILGQGFTSSTTVSFNGVPTTASVQSGTALHATVPEGATTGFVTVTTSTGTLTSNRQFIVTP